MITPKVNIDIDSLVEKLSDRNLEMGQKAMANQMLSDMDDFVPYREGTLSMTATISLDGKELHWNTPYASKVYNGAPSWNWTRDFHPLAGPEWDKVASGLYLEDWKKAFVGGAQLNA